MLAAQLGCWAAWLGCMRYVRLGWMVSVGVARAAGGTVLSGDNELKPHDSLDQGPIVGGCSRPPELLHCDY